MPTPPSDDNLHERLQSRRSSVPILQTRSIYDAFSPLDKGHTSMFANPPLCHSMPLHIKVVRCRAPR
ncbi:hypothetical protein BGZ91_001367 [Linnemannia elongata]|nr:hypothetical protein BGZ91_001367 [Linnemannia elongata]KAG0073464.1 hypothetical protein BGZ90_011555 [Linnemannia elongata]